MLVIDDDAFVAQAIARLLLPNHHVEIAEGPVQALGVLRAGARFDVVLCDISMPVMTGIELRDEVARTMPEQAERFVFVTAGITSASQRARLDSLGALVLEKPVDADLLLATVQSFIRGPLLPAATAT